MKSAFLFILAFFAWTLTAQAQSIAVRDSLLKKLNALPVTANDTTRVNALVALAFQYWATKPDTTYLLSQQAYELARRLNYPAGQARALVSMSIAFGQLGDYAKALKMLDQAKQFYIKLKNPGRIATILNNTAYTYMLQGEWQKGLVKLQEGYALYKTIPQPDPGLKPTILASIGECFYQLKQLDSASVYLNQALPLAKIKDPGSFGRIFYLLGDVALAKNNTEQAYSFYRQSIGVLSKENSYTRLNEAYYRMATFYQKTARKDSMLHYARLSLINGQKSAYTKGILKSSQFLTKLYKGQNDAEALRYYEIAVAAKDSLYSQDKMKQLLSLTFDEKQQAQEIEAAKAEYRSTVRTYIFIGLLAVLGAIALVLYRNNRQKQRANALLHRQRDEIHEQRTKAENALTELRATQTQLIQKEKLASLGELTAGIAHEIQNPLNFVNNFSEVSTELVSELREEETNADRDPELIGELLDDLTQNLQKITHHGGRASAIVKGMLEHSRSNTGERQPTDLNALADEYLRLAYHGLRAKDSQFNATMVTDFDPTLKPVTVAGQEIGRVLLNLFNNAFYAVSERKNRLAGNETPTTNVYQPTVTVSTRLAGDRVYIRVRDNGTGIPESVKARIFQPFFTTKPTGEGTGLGLSLSYDIITKGHGGTLTVETVSGEYTEFTIGLPIG